MAYSVDTMYKLIQYIISKNQQGYLSPEEFNNVIDQAQLSYSSYLIGQTQQYAPSHPMSRVSFGNNENVRQSLTPIIYEFTLSVDANGFSPYPGDYNKLDSMVNIYGTKPIRWAAQDNVTEYLNSYIDPIATNPAYVLVYNGFRFYPNNIGNAILSYVRRPPKIIWAYTLDVNGEPVYDPTQSDDPVWFEVDCLEIMSRALRMIGVNLQAQDVAQYANEIKQGGQ